MDAAGVGFPEAHQDASAMAALALTGYEVAGFDTVMPEFSVQQEAKALGCEADWGHRVMMPGVKAFPYKDFHKGEIPHDLLEKPSMQVVLDALSILKRQVGDQAAVVGKVMGPGPSVTTWPGCRTFSCKWAGVSGIPRQRMS